MPTGQNPNDPKGLIRESYRIKGISDEECRSIFLDWALSLSPEIEATQAISALLADHGDNAPAHPMTRILTDGLAPPPAPGRRGRKR